MRTFLLLALLFWAAAPAGAATLVIQNVDGVAEGFNDPTPAAPVGGNPGTTVGAQRIIAFQFAADLWGALLESEVDIVVRASFDDDLECSPNSGVLGAAAPTFVQSDFPGAPLSNTWYVDALAAALAGEDLSVGEPEIRARFQSAVGTSGCLTQLSWYYGLDGDAPSGSADLVTILLHELGHGLGFLSLVDVSSGDLFLGDSDVFTGHILDLDLGLHWDEMLTLQRRNSATNTDRVVWDGSLVNAALPDELLRTSEVEVSSPADIAGSYAALPATFGPRLDALGVTGTLVQALDGQAPFTDLCQDPTNAAELAGAIALVDRGSCDFTQKVLACEDAGALAVIVVNNVLGDPIPMGGVDPGITIPSVMVSLGVGQLLQGRLGEGVGLTLRATELYVDGVSSDRIELYAPQPVELGSSISHWNTDVLPNLLMEPFIMADVRQGVDLTLPLLADLGWTVNDPVSVVSVSLFSARRTQAGVELSWRMSGELDGVGVHVHRELEGQASERLTGLPLVAVSEGSYLDAEGPEEAVSYWLELQLTDGGTRVVGPASLPSLASTLVLRFVGAAPNPFRTSTWLEFQLPEDGPIRLTIHDLRGRLVRALPATAGVAGLQDLPFEAVDEEGNPLAAGVYVARLEAAGEVLTQKLVLLR